jgi:formylglycine-generating enzyme required for sulfatase activity
MKVFISSTYEDLKEYRKAAIDAVIKSECAILAMEHFGARAEEPVEVSLDDVHKCDIFVGIYAHCYGFVPKGSKKSITQQEYELAKKLGKPCLCFIVEEEFPWNPIFFEKEKYAALESFLKKIKDENTVTSFGSVVDFIVKFSFSLSIQLRKIDSGKDDKKDTTAGGGENTKHQVFISYYGRKKGSSGTDREMADRVCAALEENGIRCWIDHRNIPPGRDWPDEINKAISQSKIMVLVLSSNSEKSRYIKMEVTQAVNKNVTIIPFCIEDVTLRGGLELLLVDCQWIFAHSGLKKQHLKRLVDEVRARLGKKEKKSEREKDVRAAPQKQAGSKKGLKEEPADVKAVKQKGYKVYKNDKNNWGAEFDYGIVMVYIPAGEFTMGSIDGEDNEKPEHKVYLDGYWIGKFPVTFEQYDKYCEETAEKKPNDEGWGRGKRPVINVTRDEAKVYCEWLNDKTSLVFKLPTEAQWEKAARCTDGRKYPWGNFFHIHKCNSKELDLGKTSPVGEFLEGVSPYGCLDMSGNVWEWCADFFDEKYYEKSPAKNPEGAATGSGNRVVRGGANNSTKENLRTSSRGYSEPTNRHMYRGFRLAGSMYLNNTVSKPIIKHFNASKIKVENGGKVTFTYEVANADLPLLIKRIYDDGTYDTQYKLNRLSGQWADGSVIKNSTYTLEASNKHETSSEIIKIEVINNSDLPNIIKFSLSKININKNEPVDISWDVENVILPVHLVRYDEDGKHIYGDYQSAKKTITWTTPYITSTFELTASNMFGTTKKSIKLTVKKPTEQAEYILKKLANCGVEKFFVYAKAGNFFLQSFAGPRIDIPEPKSLNADIKYLEEMGLIKYSLTNSEGQDVYEVSKKINEYLTGKSK